MMTTLARLRVPTWLRLGFLLTGLALMGGRATAGEWPAGYVVGEGTTSPDGRYGILVPDEGSDEDENRLADFREKRVLGKIEGLDYKKGQARTSLHVTWAADSKWCVAEISGRDGFITIAVLEPTGSKFTQVDIDDYVRNALAASLIQQSRDKDSDVVGYARFRAGPGRTLRVRATATTNRFGRADVPEFCALFMGTFDLKTRRWLASSARKISSKDAEAMANAYASFRDGQFLVLPEGAPEPENFSGEVFRSEAERDKKLDVVLNDVYRTARLLLPPARFAVVKAEQVAWLKRRDALALGPERFKMVLARIRALQDLLW